MQRAQQLRLMLRDARTAGLRCLKAQAADVRAAGLALDAEQRIAPPCRL